MMKKLMVLVLVLAITPLAFGAASLDIQVNDTPWDGQSSVSPSDIVSLALMDSGLYVGSISVNFALTVDHGDVEEGTFVYIPSSFGLSPSLINPLDDGFKIVGPGTYITVPVPADDIVLGVSFHVPGDLQESSLINITLAGFYGGVDVAPLSTSLHVVPEPMTLCLLGLGGLFLRRRKK